MSTGQLSSATPQPNQQRVTASLFGAIPPRAVVVERKPRQQRGAHDTGEWRQRRPSSLEDGGYDITVTFQGRKTARDVTAHTPEEFQSRPASGAAAPNATPASDRHRDHARQRDCQRHHHRSRPESAGEHETPVLKRDSVR